MASKKEKEFGTKAQKMLIDWMSARKKTRQQIAVDLRIMYSQVARWVSGDATPGLRYAAEIERMTKGKVKCIMWTEKFKAKKQS